MVLCIVKCKSLLTDRKNMSAYNAVKRHLSSLFSDFKRRYSALDPYHGHIQNFIHYHLIPYRNIEDLRVGRYDRKRLAMVAAYVAVIFVNIFRFLGIIFRESHYPEMEQYFFIILEDMPNHEYVYITIVLFFLAPTILCKDKIFILF